MKPKTTTKTHTIVKDSIQISTTTLPDYIPRFVYTSDPLDYIARESTKEYTDGYYWIRIDKAMERGPFKTIKGAKISYTLHSKRWK